MPLYFLKTVCCLSVGGIHLSIYLYQYICLFVKLAVYALADYLSIHLYIYQSFYLSLSIRHLSFYLSRSLSLFSIQEQYPLFYIFRCIFATFSFHKSLTCGWFLRKTDSADSASGRLPVQQHSSFTLLTTPCHDLAWGWDVHISLSLSLWPHLCFTSLLICRPSVYVHPSP